MKYFILEVLTHLDIELGWVIDFQSIHFTNCCIKNGIQEIRENGFGRENIPAMMAAVVVISLPLIILFLIFHKKIMEGVSRGGTKG